MNSDTPRTDAQLRDYGDNPSIFPNFARQLERELSEAKDQYRMEKAEADQLRINSKWLIHQLGLLFNANKQFVKDLVEKNKQIEEMIHRTLEWIDCNTCPFGNNNDSKCAVKCREKLIRYFKTGKKEEEKK